MNIFGICLGTGACGLLLKPHLAFGILIALSIVVGIAFNYGVLRLLMKVAFNFSTKPSAGLEGCVGKTVEAISSFDQQGRGLVKALVDQEIVQLLAVLPEAERASQPTIRKGDQLVVLEVSSEKGTCVVTNQLN